MTNSVERQKKFREGQKELGRNQKIFWLTDIEWNKLKAYLKMIRSEIPG